MLSLTPSVQSPVSWWRARQRRTAAEIAAAVAPTGKDVASHREAGYVLLERYGGIVDDDEAGAANDAAMLAALEVANQFDGTVVLTSGTWHFASEWPEIGSATTGARVLGLGRPVVRFAEDVDSGEDLVVLAGDNYRQCELRDIIIDAQGAGRDALVIHAGDYPIIENVKVIDSGRDGFAASCDNFGWIENLRAHVYVENAGRHAFAFTLDGGDGAFINESTFECEARGWSKREDGGAFIYFNGEGSGGGSKFGNLWFRKTNADMQWNTGATFTPSPHLMVLAGDNSLEYADFGTAGWENTGTGSIAAGKLLETSGAAVAAVHLRSCLRTGWFAGFGANVNVLTFEDNVNQRTQLGKVAALYNFPARMQNTWVWEEATANMRQLRAKEGAAPAADTDGIPLSGVLTDSVAIATSATGNLDFPGAFLDALPHVAFCHSFIVTLQHSQYAGAGYLISRAYLVTVRPDGSIAAATQIVDASTASMIASVTFSIVGGALRAAITAGVNHATGGGNDRIFGTCVRGGFL